MLLDEKQQKYKLFVEKLYDRCQQVQSENERFVLRINTVKKLVRRRVREVDLLKRRLDKQHNDNWRALPMVAPHPKRKIEQKRGPKPKQKGNPGEEQPPGAASLPKEKKVRKQRVKKAAPEGQLFHDTVVLATPTFLQQQQQQQQQFTEPHQQLTEQHQQQQQQQIHFKQENFN